MTRVPAWFQDLSEGIILIENNRVLAINAAAAQLLGVSSPEVEGLPLIGVVRDHRLEQAYVEQREIEVEKAGHTLLAKPIHGGLLIKDLSKVKHAQEEARELLAVLSHELRTPVATMQATLEALQGEVPKALREKFLSRAQAEGERLVRLLEDLTVDVRPPQYRRLFLPDVTSRAVTLVQRTFSERSVHLIQDVAPLTVWADNDKLLQVLVNLLENAAIHGPSHKTITLQAYLSSDKNFACVVVQDQGKPLAGEAFDGLFEPHARGASVKSKGTGLGLYIVRSIAERWHGKAWGKALEAGNEFGFSVQIK
jgi:two-component system, OmpR family, phosphate regulon sensor histidine kinase PhoR